jgi:hypothetical protein
MSNSSPTPPIKHSFKEGLIEEAKKAISLSIYFNVWFCSLTFLAATALEERPIPLTIFGIAFVKAALSAKFMLIGQAIYPIKVIKNHGILRSLLIQSIFYLMIVLALNYLEAGIDGAIHGKNFIESMAAFGQADPLHVLAMAIVYWLIVWPYLIFTATQIIIGKENFLALLFGNRKSAGN